MSMSNTEKTVKDIRRKTRRKFSTEEKIRIVLDGLRGESSLPSCAAGRHQPEPVLPLEQGLSWRPARNACPAILPGKQIPMRCLVSSVRTRI